MRTVIAEVNRVLPEFEAAVFDEFALKGWDTSDLSPARIALQRRIIARTPYCFETVKAGRYFLETCTGIKHVRAEWHDLERDWDPENEKIVGHRFISVPASDPSQITNQDVIVDPTYLQFAKTPVARARMPLVYIGTRLGIMNIMQDPAFTSTPNEHHTYTAATSFKFDT